MSDERELRQLYQAMRSEDARQAPSFARVTAFARPTAANLGRLRALAITVALVMVAVLVSVNALRRGEPAPQVATGGAGARAGTHVQVAQVTARAGEAPATPAQKKVASPRRPKPQPIPSISDWQSPTASLLQGSDDLFTTVPSVGSSSATTSD